MVKKTSEVQINTAEHRNTNETCGNILKQKVVLQQFQQSRSTHCQTNKNIVVCT